MSHTCAMCDSEMGTPYGGFSIPPECMQLMDGGEVIESATIAHKITIDLCSACTEIVRQMVINFETSPLPECNADAARWQDVRDFAAEADGEHGLSDNLIDRMLDDALITVKTHLDGEADIVSDSKVVEAYTIVLSLQELGLVESNSLRDSDE